MNDSTISVCLLSIVSNGMVLRVGYGVKAFVPYAGIVGDALDHGANPLISVQSSQWFLQRQPSAKRQLIRLFIISLDQITSFSLFDTDYASRASSDASQADSSSCCWACRMHSANSAGAVLFVPSFA